MDNSYKGRYLDNSIVLDNLFSLVYEGLNKNELDQMSDTFKSLPVSFKQQLYPDLNFINGDEGVGVRVQIILDYLQNFWDKNHLYLFLDEIVIRKLEQKTLGIFTSFAHFSKSINTEIQKIYVNDESMEKYNLHISKTYGTHIEEIFIDTRFIPSKHKFISSIEKSKIKHESLKQIRQSAYEGVSWLSELHSGLHFTQKLEQKDIDIWLSIFKHIEVLFKADNPLGIFVNKKLKEK